MYIYVDNNMLQKFGNHCIFSVMAVRDIELPPHLTKNIYLSRICAICEGKVLM